MYSVNIIDDEPWAIKLIEKGFPWQQYAFYVQGKSRTVSQALQEIPQMKPDVIFTDIRIAGSNGIDLIRQLQLQGVDAVFVIVTGYDDFDVAKAAIKLKVFDLLLKPIDLEESEALLHRLHVFLEGRSTQRKPLMEQLDGMSVSQCLAHFSQGATDGAVRAVFIRNVQEDQTASLTQQPLLTLFPGNRQLLYLFQHRSSFEAGLLGQLETLYSNCGIGVSETANLSDPVLVPVTHAQMMAFQSFMTGITGLSVYTCSHYKSVVHLAQALLEGASYTPDELYKLWLQESWHSEDLAHLVRFLSQSSLVPPVSNYQDLFRTYENAHALALQLLSILSIHKAAPAIIEPEDIHRRLLQMIQQRFTENLSLSQLAQELNLSVSYVSEIFARYQGISFSKYLKHVRNARACELLKGTNIPIQDVAELSGFNDYFYFCKQFKTEFGLTPKQYRLQNRA